MARTKNSAAAPRAPRRTPREMLVSHLRSLSVDDLCEVFYEFGGLAPRAAPLAIDSIQKGLLASAEGTLQCRVSAPPPMFEAPAASTDFGEDAED